MKRPRRIWEHTTVWTSSYGNPPKHVDALIAAGWQPYAAHAGFMFLRRRSWKLA